MQIVYSIGHAVDLGFRWVRYGCDHFAFGDKFLDQKDPPHQITGAGRIPNRTVIQADITPEISSFASPSFLLPIPSPKHLRHFPGLSASKQTHQQIHS
jgi:hypothetical protein